MTQTNLLDYHPPAIRTSATSQAAADAIRPNAATLRARVLEAIRARPEGLTDEEGQTVTGLEGNTYRPRRRELEKAGLVRLSLGTRLTRSGRAAAVWIAG